MALRYSNCYCDTNPYTPIDNVHRCYDTDLDLGSIGSKVLNGYCGSGWQSVSVDLDRRVCFDIKPGTELTTLTVKLKYTITNNMACAAEVKMLLTPLTVLSTEPCTCTIGSAKESTQTYFLDVDCVETNVDFTFALTGMSISTACIIKFKIELGYNCCPGTFVVCAASSASPKPSGGLVITASDIGAGWNYFTDAYESICSGDICKTDASYVGFMYSYKIINESGKCVEIYFRHTNIVHPEPCTIKFAMTAISGGVPVGVCDTGWRPLIGSGPDGAFAFMCICGFFDDEVTIAVGYGIDGSVEDCCETGFASFDVEYYVICQGPDTGFGPICDGSPGANLGSICSPSCPNCEGSGP